MGKKKVLIINTVVQNGGDAAILDALIGHVRNVFGEDVSFSICDSNPTMAKKLYSEYDFRPMLLSVINEEIKGIVPKVVPGIILNICLMIWWYLSVPRFYAAAVLCEKKLNKLARGLLFDGEYNALDLYASADVVISTGGTYLVEKYDLRARLFEFRITHLLKRPLVLYTQSLGPFEKYSNRRAFRDVFNKAELVLLRDDQSLQNVVDICGDVKNTHVLSDVVFSLAEGDRMGFKGRIDEVDNTMPIKIGVSVRDWSYFKSLPSKEGMQLYCNAMADIVVNVVKSVGAEVVFISTCQGVPHYYNDAEVAKRVYNMLPDTVRANVIVDEDFHRPEELMAILKGFDLVIATRMHMSILAMCAGIPVVPIVYEFKTQELLDKVGLSHWMGNPKSHNIEGIDSDYMVEVIGEMLRSRKQLCSVLSNSVQAEKVNADRAMLLLEGVVSNQLGRPALVEC